mmetsp:Transcript_92980/g.156115  ORF Transcript_92980/g.156115 Transcript_92980/m.156115 type:complete len:99 (-) Transcript_92980:100-396(-)
MIWPSDLLPHMDGAFSAKLVDGPSCLSGSGAIVGVEGVASSEGDTGFGATLWKGRVMEWLDLRAPGIRKDMHSSLPKVAVLERTCTKFPSETEPRNLE